MDSDDEKCAISDASEEEEEEVRLIGQITPLVSSILPYQFEPVAAAAAAIVTTTSFDSDEGSSSDESEQNNRLGNVDWCTCGNCIPMATQKESLCCKEMALLQGLFREMQQKGINSFASFSLTDTGTYVYVKLFEMFVYEIREMQIAVGLK